MQTKGKPVSSRQSPEAVLRARRRENGRPLAAGIDFFPGKATFYAQANDMAAFTVNHML